MYFTEMYWRERREDLSLWRSFIEGTKRARATRAAESSDREVYVISAGDGHLLRFPSQSRTCCEFDLALPRSTPSWPEPSTRHLEVDADLTLVSPHLKDYHHYLKVVLR